METRCGGWVEETTRRSDPRGRVTRRVDLGLCRCGHADSAVGHVVERRTRRRGLCARWSALGGQGARAARHLHGRPADGAGDRRMGTLGSRDRPQQIAGRSVAPSWSDLQFLDGHLYALHRDARAVVRLAADTGAPTGTMWLALDEQSIYDTTKPYGMAEGLWIEDDAVFILLDNNSDNMKAGPRAGEPAPMLFEYPRPSGF